MIYLDNSATTKVNREVEKVISEYNSKFFYNPSAIYAPAIKVSEDINIAREKLARFLKCEKGNIIYCSSGTEANNTAIKSALKRKTGRVIITEGEHLSVFNPVNSLSSLGYDIKLAKLNRDGTCDIDHLLSLITDNTLLVSVIHVSNETGAINDIEEIAGQVKLRNPNTIFHSDGVQAFLKLNSNLSGPDIDMYSISGHKVHAPKGVAALISKVDIKPMLEGGGQEKGRRSGTENVAGIIALSKSIEIFGDSIEKYYEKNKAIREAAIRILREKLKDIQIHALKNGSPYVLSFSLPRIKSEIVLQLLSEKNVFIGSGSACSAKQKTSRVMNAIKSKYPQGTLRLSFNYETTLEEVKCACEEIVIVCNKF